MEHRLGRTRTRGAQSAAVFTACLLLSLPLTAQQSRFTIHRGNQVLGSVVAQRVALGDRMVYSMISLSEFQLVLRQVVRSMHTTEYRDGRMALCHTRVTVNGALRDSSHGVHEAAALNCYVHPRQRFVHDGEVHWTTARMYFEEPVDQSSIFVESVMRPCPLQRVGPGRYKLLLPGHKANLYCYEGGRLQALHVDRGLFELVFRSAD